MDVSTVLPSMIQRLGWLAVSVGGVVLFGGVAITQDRYVFAVFCVPALSLALDSIRARVVVDRSRGLVTSQRAIRETVVRLADVESVGVPRRGSMSLLLRPEGERARVRTSLLPGEPGPDSTAARLAAALDVPVRSARRRDQSERAGASGN